jgi:diketogulonate reductase-like aldo/keto reductase
VGTLDSPFPACETKPMVNQIRWFIGLDPSDTVQKCAEHDIVVEAYSPFAHGLIVNHPEIGSGEDHLQPPASNGPTPSTTSPTP